MKIGKPLVRILAPEGVALTVVGRGAEKERTTLVRVSAAQRKRNGRRLDGRQPDPFCLLTFSSLAGRPQVRDQIAEIFLDNYGTQDHITMTVDFIQSNLKCCGVEGPSDWADAMYNTGKITLPFHDRLSSHRPSFPPQYLPVPA